MSQVQAQSDVVKTVSHSARPKGDCVPGLQSHVESPGAQRLDMPLKLLTTIVIVTRVLVGLGHLFTIEVEPGLVVFSIVLNRLNTVRH